MHLILFHRTKAFAMRVCVCVSRHPWCFDSRSVGVFSTPESNFPNREFAPRAPLPPAVPLPHAGAVLAPARNEPWRFFLFLHHVA